MKTKILITLLLALLISCKSDKKSTLENDSTNENVEVKKTDFIEITTRSMEFQMPDTIPTGWNTFKYNNLANETHFFRFIKLPEGITIENYKKEVDPVFEKGMDLINEGKPDQGFAAFGKLPEWFGKTIPYGGSGLIAPKNATFTTLKLDPGNYIIECYVKMPNGKFHSTMGMIKDVYVTDKDSGNQPPKETETINIAADGFHFNDSIKSGEHIFKVNINSQKLHENFALSDVHLVKLSTEANLDSLEKWMVWYNPKGFITPVPEGMRFLGGFNDAVEGASGYFKAELASGNYALISEVPNAKAKGMLKIFEVQ